MRSSSAKLALGVTVWVAFGAAALFVLQSEQQLTARRSALRAFDVVARETAAALTGVKAAQQGYVAPGQGLGFWMSRVDALLSDVATRIAELDTIVVTDEGRQALSDATDTAADVRAIDTRARQYLTSDQALMAADVVFSEGGETAAMAARHVEAARHAEYVAFDAAEAATRHQQVYAASAAIGFAALAIALLVAAPRRSNAVAQATDSAAPVHRTGTGLAVDAIGAAGTVGRTAAPSEPAAAPANLEPVVPPQAPVAPDLPRDAVPVLTAAAELCQELNRARDLDELTRLLGRAAEVLDASGLVVWVGAPGASALRPVLAHGYSPHALARMPHVPRTGDNAAAAAFRTGKLQIVLTRPGMASGALAAPMLTPNGCIGALTAEIKNGGEASDGVQALAAIVASQLAGVLAESVLQSEEAEDSDQPMTRVASA